ncbi:MAG: THUMP domain-containing protein [Methanobacterium sp.]
MMTNEKFDLVVEIEENKAPPEFDEYMAIEKLEDKLKNYDSRFYIKESEFYNVFLVELLETNINAALKLAETSLKKNFDVVPIELVVSSKPEIILKNIINISKNKIKDGETFTIKCNIRGTRYIKSKEKFMDSIYKELEKTKGQPDETRPDWIIHIEVVGEHTGISVVKRK